MIKKKVYILALTSILSQFNCIDEIPFENNKIFNRINITGQLSDDLEMKYIEIRKIPSEIDKSQANGDPIENASVWISDDQGSNYTFKYIGKGIYASEVKGEIGRQYKLEVIIGDHKYESSYQKMMVNAPIDSVRAEIGEESVVDQNGRVNSRSVVNLVLNTTLESNGQPIFTVYRISGEYEFHEIGIIGSFQIPKSCYIKQDFDTGKINAFSFFSFPNNQLLERRVFQTDHDFRFLYRFSFLVNQYSVDSTTYVYWNNLGKILKEEQDLFDPPPGRLFGNIYCTSHENEDPYGNFTVGSKTVKRIFTNSNDLGVPGINLCSRNPPRICYDCLSISSNSSTTRPPYWQ